MTEQTEQKAASFIQLTDQGMNRLIQVLDVARRAGTRQEAMLALQFVSIIETNATQLKQPIKEVKNDEGTAEKEENQAHETAQG